MRRRELLPPPPASRETETGRDQSLVERQVTAIASRLPLLVHCSRKCEQTFSRKKKKKKNWFWHKIPKLPGLESRRFKSKVATLPYATEAEQRSCISNYSRAEMVGSN